MDPKLPSKRLKSEAAARVASRFAKLLSISAGFGVAAVERLATERNTIEFRVSLGRRLGRFTVIAKAFEFAPDPLWIAYTGIDEDEWDSLLSRERAGEKIIVLFIDSILRRMYWARVPELATVASFEDPNGKKHSLPFRRLKRGEIVTLCWPILYFEKVLANLRSRPPEGEPIYALIDNFEPISDAEADAIHAHRTPGSLAGIARVPLRDVERDRYFRTSLEWERRGAQGVLALA